MEIQHQSSSSTHQQPKPMAIKFRFGPQQDSTDEIFSEIEKMPTVEEDERRAEKMEENCSQLWNQVKDAAVLEDAELTDALLDHLQSKSEFLSQQIDIFSQNPRGMNATNVQLRLTCVQSALDELKQKKVRADARMGFDNGGGECRSNWMSQFRKWLHHQEELLAGIQLRIPRSKNSLSSLHELELEQKALQEQIQTEGRAQHQQLCSNNDNKDPVGKQGQLCRILEQRYLALWLASLESLELIGHFKGRLVKNFPDELLLATELEEGPDPKRRKTLAQSEQEEAMAELQHSQQQKQLILPLAPKVGMTGLTDDAKQQQQQRLFGSDIGYSSGENNSLHEGTTNTNSEENNRELLEEQPSLPVGQEPLWAEQIALSSELEKSFYRTVPLDEFGMTDLDTDEGQQGNWPRSSFLAMKFMDDMEKNGPGLELTDSLIVHVDTPESRQLNDFEEVMDLLDHPEQQPKHVPFSEDDCESLSTDDWTERHLPFGSRKRALPKTPMTATNSQTPIRSSDLLGRQKKQNGRRKLATVRKSRSSGDGWTPGAGGNWECGNNCLSSDFEWDEDFGGACRVGRRAISRDQTKDLDLPDDIEGGQESLLFARKKALCAFRDSLRQAATDSSNLSVRLQELLALVDKSLGGVDSAAFLVAELNSAFASLSRLCQSLESKMGRFDCARKEEEKENCKQGTPNIGQIKDMESELMLCHERMNALETTCNNLALLLGNHLADRSNCIGDAKSDRDYLAQFAAEYNRIRGELQKLKDRLGQKFVFCSIQLPELKGAQQTPKEPRVDSSAQTTIAECRPSQRPAVRREASFWHSYLLLCLLGFLASLGTLMYAGSRQGADWRWSFGPQLHYTNGPPPI